jgi:hypothetical protein
MHWRQQHCRCERDRDLHQPGSIQAKYVLSHHSDKWMKNCFCNHQPLISVSSSFCTTVYSDWFEEGPIVGDYVIKFFSCATIIIYLGMTVDILPGKLGTRYGEPISGTHRILIIIIMIVLFLITTKFPVFWCKFVFSFITKDKKISSLVHYSYQEVLTHITKVITIVQIITVNNRSILSTSNLTEKPTLNETIFCTAI